MPDCRHPWAPKAIADDAGIAARAHHGSIDSCFLQHCDPPVDCVALADSAKIDAHTRARESHRGIARNELNVAKIDARECGRDLSFIRPDMAAVIVQIAD